MKNKKLTHKERIFCKAYLSNGFNGTQAALTAKYSEKCPRQIATELLTKPHIKLFLDKRMAEVEKKLDITLEWKMEKLKRVVDECFQGKGNEISPSNIVGAIAELNKMQGHYAAEKKEIKHDVGNKTSELIAKYQRDY